MPWILASVVHLLQWTGESLHDAVGLQPVAQRTELEVGGAVLLVGAITLGTTLGLHPLLTVSGGLGLAVLLVVMRSWRVAQGQPQS